MTPVFYFFNSFLLVRFFTQWSDERHSSFKENLIQGMITALLLAPLFTSWIFTLITLFIVIAYQILTATTEKREKNIFWGRALQLAGLIILSTTLYGVTLQTPGFTKAAENALTAILKLNILTRSSSPEDFTLVPVYLFGILITIQELNHIIRAILKSIKAAPLKDNDNKESVDDSEELKRGKIIGGIERLLFFFFVLTGHYGSIGFILAAKGITRFKELDDKNFAEYFLIGTLLSSSLSILTAELIKRAAI